MVPHYAAGALACTSPIGDGEGDFPANWPRARAGLYDRGVDFVRAVSGSDLSLVSGRGHYEEVVAAVLAARRSV